MHPRLAEAVVQRPRLIVGARALALLLFGNAAFLKKLSRAAATPPKGSVVVDAAQITHFD